MIFYLLFFIVFISVCCVNDLFFKRKCIKIIILSLLCLSLVLFLGLKGKNVGSDTANYMSIYEKALEGSNLGHVSSDYGYAFICKLFARMRLPYVAFSLFVAFLEVVGIFVLCLVLTKYSAIFFASFFAISQLQMLISAQRQSIACSFVFLAVAVYFLLKNKSRFLRLAIYFFICTIAFLFHKSSAIAFLFPILFIIKFNFKHVVLFSVLTIILCFSSTQLAELFTLLHLTAYSYFNIGTFQTYSFFGLLLSTLIYYLFSIKKLVTDGDSLLSFGDYKKHFKNTFNLEYHLSCNVLNTDVSDNNVAFSTRFISLGFVGAIFMSFSSFSGTLTRFAFFCFPFLYLALSNSISLLQKREKMIVYFSLLIFFLAMFIWLFIYKDPLKCVPYYVEF